MGHGKRKTPEATLQCTIVQYLKLVLPMGSLVHHSPNEGNHKPWYRSHQIAMGMHSGWPDLEIIVIPNFWKNGTKWSPIFIEVKAQNGRLTQRQKKTIEDLQVAGCHVFVCKSIDDLIKCLSPLVSLKDTQSSYQL